jgi:hypothetical protein
MATSTSEEFDRLSATQKDLAVAITKSLTDAVMNSLDTKLDAKLSGIVTNVTNVTARVDKLENAATHQYKADKARLVTAARKDFDAATRRMFDESSLMLSPPATSRFQPGPPQKVHFDPKSPAMEARRLEICAELDKTAGTGKYTVDTTKRGYRLVHNGNSFQARRSDAKRLIEDFRAPWLSQFELYLHYDRPYEYRQILKRGRDLMSKFKGVCPTVKKVGIVDGICHANSLPLGPAWLVPGDPAAQ